MERVKILLADDHTIVRAGVRLLLKGVNDLEVVGEADNGHEALDLVKSLHPDIVILDIAMKSLNGLEVASRISRDHPEIKTIILSMHASEEYVNRALQAGVRGYLLKDSIPAELEIAVQAVLRGETYLSPGVSKYVVDSYLKRTSGQVEMEEVREDQFLGLTSRQREILQLIAEGSTTKEIAAKLNLSAKTVETHRTELMNRLDIHDIAGLVRYAIRIGLVSPDT